MNITCDTKLLKQQIYDVLRSNMSVASKTGLHSFLGAILDNLEIEKEIRITKWDRRKKGCDK